MVRFHDAVASFIVDPMPLRRGGWRQLLRTSENPFWCPTFFRLTFFRRMRAAVGPDMFALPIGNVLASIARATCLGLVVPAMPAHHRGASMERRNSPD